MTPKDVEYYAKKCGLKVSWRSRGGIRRYEFSRDGMSLEVSGIGEADIFLAGVIDGKLSCGEDVFKGAKYE
jgi:hypothetical protein